MSEDWRGLACCCTRTRFMVPSVAWLSALVLVSNRPFALVTHEGEGHIVRDYALFSQVLLRHDFYMQHPVHGYGV
jgi:hypothetical protein